MTNTFLSIYQLLSTLLFVLIYLGGVIAIALGIASIIIITKGLSLQLGKAIMSAPENIKFCLYKSRYWYINRVLDVKYDNFSMESDHLINKLRDTDLFRYSRHCYVNEENGILLTKKVVILDAKIWIPDNPPELSHVMKYLRDEVFDK